MTKPTKQFARDVATQLDRSRRRRRLVGLLVLAAVVAAGIMFLTCGKGWGLGGGGGTGTARGTGSAAPTADVGPKQCTIRVAKGGIFVDGTKQTRDQAVARCKTTEGALVTVTGDARQGDWDELRAALEAGGVKVFLRGQRGQAEKTN